MESASELDAKQKSSLKQMLETKLNKTVELDIAIKPELIAGMKGMYKRYGFRQYGLIAP